jgi:hypothetical protein
MLWKAPMIAVGLAAFGCAQAVLAASNGSAIRPETAAVLRLQPNVRVVRPTGSSVVSDGRYALVWRQGVARSPGTITDEQTARQSSFTAPSGCSLDGTLDPLGGTWVLASCEPPDNAYALFDIRTRSWRKLFASHAVFGASRACASGSYDCSAVPVSVGAYWIEFYVNCVEHCYSPAYAFENIQTGAVQKAPRDWRVGGHTIPNLGSRTLAQTLCSPLAVPEGPNGLPGSFTFIGRFAISTYEINSGHGPPSADVFLRQCGSRTKVAIDPSVSPIAANNRVVLWNMSGTSRTHPGLLLPSLRDVSVTGPSPAERTVLSSKHLFFVGTNGKIWETTEQFPPLTRR